VVRPEGLEPSHPKITDFKSVAATSYATVAGCCSKDLFNMLCWC